MKIVNYRQKRKKRNKGKVKGNKQKPRVCVFRSNRYVYVQAIDDENSKTIVSFNERMLSAKGRSKSKIENAKVIGKRIGEKMKLKKIKKIVFDKSGYKYHGRVKAVAEGIREEGIKF